MNCRQTQDLLPAYALGALEASEGEAVEAHVALCPRCAPIAAGYLRATAALALVAPPTEPPPGLRSRVLQRAAQTSQLPPVAPVLGARRLAVAPLTLLTSRRRLPLWAASVAAAVSLVVAAALLLAVADLRKEIRQLREDNQQITEMLLQQRDLVYTMAIPGMETTLLRSAGGAAKARGMMMVSKDHTWGVVVCQDLELKKSMGYQLWLTRDGQRVNGGLLSVDETGYGYLWVKYPEPLHLYSGVSVTLEPTGGSAWPTTDPVLSAPVQAQ